MLFLEIPFWGVNKEKALCAYWKTDGLLPVFHSLKLLLMLGTRTFFSHLFIFVFIPSLGWEFLAYILCSILFTTVFLLDRHYSWFSNRKRTLKWQFTESNLVLCPDPPMPMSVFSLNSLVYCYNVFLLLTAYLHSTPHARTPS